MIDPHSRLLENLLEAACIQAEGLLREHDPASRALGQLKSDLELSPLVEKQLIGAALQVAMDHCLVSGIRTSLLNRFRALPPGVAIEAQRRSVEADVMQRGLPMELASDYVHTLEHRLALPSHELPEMLWAYGSLYGELWNDPRIGAGTPTRRIMLAMTTALRARSAQLNASKAAAPPHSAARHLPTMPVNGAAL
ncbi:hypothetical protein [Sphingobium indicum]|nr:hypothetical protein [Sphingobium indicum]